MHISDTILVKFDEYDIFDANSCGKLVEQARDNIGISSSTKDEKKQECKQVYHLLLLLIPKDKELDEYYIEEFEDDQFNQGENDAYGTFEGGNNWF